MSDIITRDENGDLAVRTVAATETAGGSDYDDLYARTTDGKRALRVVGAGGSGGGLPDQTGHTGFLQTDGTNATWSDKVALINVADSPTISLAVGGGSGTRIGSTAVGINAHAQNSFSVVLGNNATTQAQGSVVVGYGGRTTSPNTAFITTATNLVTVNGADSLFFGNTNGAYKVIQPDGTIPSERLAADGTTGQVLSKTDTGMQWVDMTGGTMVVATPPTAAGTYVLKATVADDGTVTTAWVAE